MSDRSSPPEPFDGFERSSERVARYRWAERRMFEVVGGWVPTTPEPEAKLVFRSQSFLFAGHAELWEGLLPTGPLVDVDDVAAAGGLLDTLAAAGPTRVRACGLGQVVLPWLADALRQERARLTLAAGGPRRRVVALVLRDLDAAVAALDELLAYVTVGEPGREELAMIDELSQRARNLV